MRKELELFSENTASFWESSANDELEVVEDTIASMPSLSEMQGGLVDFVYLLKIWKRLACSHFESSTLQSITLPWMLREMRKGR